METKYLYEFAALAENGNYWHTAGDLFISQSSLSKHIKALEKELGVSLFDRTTRKVRLSAEGELFLPYAVKITQMLDEHNAVSELRRKGGTNTVSIASTSQMTHYRMITDALAHYKRLHLDCRLDVIIEPHKNLKSLLQQHKADFIWIGEPEDEFHDKDFNRLPFLTEPLVAVFSNQHPLSRLEAIPLQALEDQDIIIQDNSSIEQRVFLELCREHDLQPRITSLPGGSVLNFVQSELGVAIMLRSVAQTLRTPELSVVDIKDSPVVHVNLLSLKGHTLSPTAKNFLTFLQTWQQND